MLGASLGIKSFNRELIAPVTLFERARNAADGGHANAGLFVNFAIREALIEQPHDPPAINQGLQLSGCGQIFEQRSTLIGSLHGYKGFCEAGSCGLIGLRMLVVKLLH